MKLVLFALMFTPLFSKSQEKINGFGLLKVSILTTEKLFEIAKDNNLKTGMVNTSIEEIRWKINTKKYLIELKFNKDNPSQSPIYSYCYNDVRVFKISLLKISNIEFYNMYLSFYRDTLFSIKCDYSKEIEDAIEIKYGVPVKDLKEEEVSCIYKLTGNKTTLKEKTFYKKWDHDDINAYTVVRNYYDTHCQEQFSSYVIIESVTISSFAHSADNKCRDALSDNNKKEKAKVLSDF